jgi:inner membrane protein
MGLYLGAMILGSHFAREDVRAWLADRGIVAEELAAGPEPADPFVREVIARVGDRYYFVERAWGRDLPIRASHPPIPIGERDEVVEAALSAVHGLRGWLRFPSFEVEDSDEGYVVTIVDVRYSRRDSGGLGRAVVHLDRQLTLLRVER